MCSNHTIKQARAAASVSLASIAKCFVIASLLLHRFSASAQQSGHLHIRVNGPNGRGELAYIIFKDSSGFPQNTTKALRHGFLASGASRNDIDLGELPKGRYAVSLYLDENGNRKLDSGWLGIPKEPVGVSGNPKPHKGPPRFAESAFEMGEKDIMIEITMVKP